jgi:hypothetical protein
MSSPQKNGSLGIAYSLWSLRLCGEFVQSPRSRLIIQWLPRIMKNPEVTVLMTVYNGDRFLREAISSVLAQDFGNFEFIIVDDGSTDGSSEIMDSFKDDRLVISKTRHIGRSNVLNHGMSLARAPYVAFLDADDVSLPGRLKTQYEMMAANRSLDLVGSFYDIIDDDGRLLDRACLPTDPVYILWRLQFQCIYLTSTVILRPGPALKAGLFPEDMIVAHDYKLFLSMARPLNTRMIPRFLSRYRISAAASQLTLKRRGRMVEEVAHISNNALKKLNPKLTTEICAEMRPIYWTLEREFVTPAALAAIPETLAAFCRTFELNEETTLRLTRKIAGDALRSVIRNCDGRFWPRMDLAMELIRVKPSALAHYFLIELKRVVTRLFKHTKAADSVLRFVHSGPVSSYGSQDIT